MTGPVHWTVLAVGAIGAALVIADPWAHRFGVLPYLFLLACLLLYLLLHGRHRRGSGPHHPSVDEE